MSPSRTADALIAKAKECYALDLISESTLENVVRRAESEPGYDALLELPFDWTVERERELRRSAARKGWLRRLVRRAAA